jgi:hypothetical protein
LLDQFVGPTPGVVPVEVFVIRSLVFFVIIVFGGQCESRGQFRLLGRVDGELVWILRGLGVAHAGKPLWDLKVEEEFELDAEGELVVAS